MYHQLMNTEGKFQKNDARFATLFQLPLMVDGRMKNGINGARRKRTAPVGVDGIVIIGAKRG